MIQQERGDPRGKISLYLSALQKGMKKNRKLHTRLQILSAIGMIVALSWLTVSMPFVYASQQEWAKITHSANGSPLSGNEEESSCPMGNATEEKAPSSTNLSEEYLHDHFTTHHFSSELSTYHKSDDDGTYIAFHGEMLVPPPNQA